MSPEDALFNAVHDYPGGAVSLAPRMKLARSTLQNMADPRQPDIGWPLKRVRQVIHLTGDKGPLQALCEEFGGMFVQLERFEHLPEGRLMKAVGKLAREFGDVPRRLEEALKGDGRISKNELHQIEREIAELNAASAAVLAVARRICETHQRVDDADRP